MGAAVTEVVKVEAALVAAREVEVRVGGAKAP